jgi:anti-sigma regulatory factor (Ser/Thr protein kinase)
MILPLHLRVDEASHVGTARRLAAALCRELGFGEVRAAEATLVVTELATNLVKHTGGAGGTIVFQPLQQVGGVGLDILSLDLGPGIANIAQSLRDGHSTAGSTGTGLGAIRRLSSQFDLYSAPGQGVALLSRLWHIAPAAASALAVGAVCLPVQGEQVCGDAWAMKAVSGSTLFMLADGLGHGPDAAQAAELAVAIFHKHAPCSPAQLLELIHAGLRSTRGAVLALAELSLAQGVMRFAGVGNIAALILDGPNCRNMISYNGTAGVEVGKIREFSYPWPAGGTLVLHSDGLATHWNLEHYPGLARKHPALIAGVLFRDHHRARDDSTVLVAREERALP